MLYGFLLERVTELSWKVRRATEHEVEVAEGKYEREVGDRVDSKCVTGTLAAPVSMG